MTSTTNLNARRRNRLGCICWGSDSASIAALPDFAAAGCGWVRATRQTQFDAVATGPGTYDWSRGGGHSIDIALANGLAVMGILDARFGHECTTNKLAWCSPIWEHLDAWTDFVRAALRHYRGRIHCWEVINEPPFFWWHPTPAGEPVPQHCPDLRRAPIRRYAELLKATAATIRAEDPDAIIVAGSTFSDGLFLQRLYEEGCRDAFDVVAVHYLNCRHPEDYATGVRRLRQVMATNADGAKPIWDTESGPGGAVIGMAVQTPAEYEALYNIYRHCFACEFGIERYFWFNPVNGSEPGTNTGSSVRQADGAFTPPYQAQRTLVDQVGDGALIASAHPGREAHVYVFAGPHGPVSVLWSTAPAQARLPGGADALGHLGGVQRVDESFALSGRPIYIPGNVLERGLVVEVTGRRETVVPCWADKQAKPDTPRVASPRVNTPLTPGQDWAALPLLAGRDQITVGPQIPTHFCTVSTGTPGEIRLGHDERNLYLDIRTFDDRLNPKRPWGLVQLALRDSDPAVAEWPFFTNAYCLLSLYHGPRGTRLLRHESLSGNDYPVGPVDAVRPVTQVLPDGLRIQAAIPWSVIGPCRPGRHNPFLATFTIGRADHLLDVPDDETPEEWSHNFADPFIVRPPALVRWIEFA